MGNLINLSPLIPLVPLGMTIFIFILLRSFNLTVNRLTKPVSYLIIFSFLVSSILSSFLLVNHIEGTVLMTKYLALLNESDMKLYLNQPKEKLLAITGLISSLIVGYSLWKLPRQKGYVLYVVIIGFITSLVDTLVLTLDFL